MRDFLKVFSKEGSFFHVKFRVFFFLFFLYRWVFEKERKKKRTKKRARIQQKKNVRNNAPTRDGRTLSPRAHLREEKRDEVVSRRSELFFFFRNARAPTGQALVASVVVSSFLCPLLFWRIF